MAAIQGAHAVVLLPTLLLGVAFSMLLSPATRALAGLRLYYAAGGGAAAQGGGRAKKVKAGKGSRGEENDIDLGGAESLFVAVLGRGQAAQLQYFGALDNLVSWLF